MECYAVCACVCVLAYAMWRENRDVNGGSWSVMLYLMVVLILEDGTPACVLCGCLVQDNAWLHGVFEMTGVWEVCLKKWF